ncbi:MAG: ECF transporter S component [Candidatus Bathyarchaeota archaeon]|nr:MAG: ECF transporter S component [Candidatus Bathyarchaeota archaeon]
MEIPVKQLTTISLLVATAAAVRVGMNLVAFAIPILAYGVVVKIGLSETLAFTSGFVFGPVQGFITGVLIIIVSDLFTWAGLWTPIIAAIIGLLGICGGMLRRSKENSNGVFLGATAVLLTLISESLQNLYTTWFYLVSGMPLVVALGTAFSGGIISMITAIINNTVLFTTIVPRIVRILRRMVMGYEKNL